jgi:beta-N-acetylhexosaminidase
MTSKSNPLTLEQKIGQLLVVGFHGTALDDERVVKIGRQIASGMVGGVVIYRYNIENKPQLTQLMRGLRRFAGTLPLLTVIDQEGGRVQRLNSSNGFIDSLSAKQVGSELDQTLALEHYRQMGDMLEEAGFNFDCAPCVDLDDDPPSPAIGKLERSYGKNPDVVANYAAAMIAGLSEHGIAGSLKHFPGHGRVRGDTHTGLINITSSWSDEELEPYRILASSDVAQVVMTAHLVHDGIDPGTPVTFSKKWLERLRTEIGFDGVAITDDLHMGALIHDFPLDQIICRAIAAGHDLCLFSNNPLAAKAQGIRHDVNSAVQASTAAAVIVPDHDLPEKFQACVLDGLSSGLINEAQIDAAFNRVVALKKTLK